MSLSHLKKKKKKTQNYEEGLSILFFKITTVLGGFVEVVGWVALFLRTPTGVLPSLASLELS